MKTHIILFLTVLFVSVPLWGQQKKLTFHLDNVTVKEALDTIKYKDIHIGLMRMIWM